jgi:hypothetical protein
MVHSISHSAPNTRPQHEATTRPAQAPPPPKKAEAQDSVQLSEQAKASLKPEHTKGR